MTRSTYGYRGVVLDIPTVRAELRVLERMHPLGSRIRHVGGRQGTVTLDQPAHVPGTFDGRATAWCLTSGTTAEALICAAWDNDQGIRWIGWVPLAKLSPATPQPIRRNTPGGR
ncbi:hypothetical protein [Streptomyces sp. NPDC091212]|uniref:hypothetical protein n=1 Tax=Streptomyces sp. NPDC091212 TaxID=3155191 RepID=UPI003418D7CE